MGVFRLRELDTLGLTDLDSAKVSSLAEAVSDGGRISFRARCLVPLPTYCREVRLTSIGVLAEDVATGRAAGAAFVSTGTCILTGHHIRYALLHSLQVHPHFRRRGLAAEMTAWRFGRTSAAAAALGEPAPVVLATIQAGNEPSLANARRWAGSISEPLIVTPVPMRRRPPASSRSPAAREATVDDLEVVADGMATSRSGSVLRR